MSNQYLEMIWHKFFTYNLYPATINIMKTISVSLRSIHVLSILVVFLLLPFSANALENNTIFMPVEINSQDKNSMAKYEHITDKIFAEVIKKYNQQLQHRNKPTKATESDYIATGSLTIIANQISLDFQVNSVLSKDNPIYFYQQANSIEELPQIAEKLIKEITQFTNREFTISSLSSRGNRMVDSGAILRRIKSKKGSLYSTDTLRNDIKTIYQMGYFDTVQLDVENDKDGKKIVFIVKEKPVIKKVTFSGYEKIEITDIEAVAGIEKNTIFNQQDIDITVATIKALYKAKGYYETTVRPDITYPNKDKVTINFTINEGKKIYIKAITFNGNKTFTARELNEIIETKTKTLLSWFTADGLLNMGEVRQDAARINAFYHNSGFIEARVGEPKLEQIDNSLHINFDISEGKRYKVGKISIAGDMIIEENELLKLLQISKEEFLSRKILRSDITRIVDLYSEHGYAFTDVNPKMDKSPIAQAIDIKLNITKGSLVHINRITIKGNSRTRDNVIRRDLAVKEGGIFDSKAVRVSTQKLKRLEFFEEVNIVPEPTLDPDKVDLVVEVTEQNTGQFSIGAGYSSADSFTVMGSISESNFLGRGDKLSLQANLSGKSSKFNFSYKNPRVLDSQLSWSLDLYNQEREYDEYDKLSTGGAIGVGYPIWKRWRAFGRYNYTDTSISDITGTTATPEMQSTINLPVTSALSVSFSEDTRDRYRFTTKGHRHDILLKHAGGILGGDAEFTHLEATTSHYFPMPWDTVFHLKGSIGQVWENGTDTLPIYDTFYLGGLNSVRGFDYRDIYSHLDTNDIDRLGGRKMWFTNVEYIFPLLKEAGVKGVIFTDAGKVYANSEDWFDTDTNNIKVSVGAGIRWLSPMGPLRIEWGYNIDPEPSEEQDVLDFSIGGSF